ncbi:uncharacterized protein LOC118348925 [Juglans regia]|uniref:Uncharacterized protein LOC118348925 n=1 Tax=Juglans regia TaxID=51240 RepID=A0A6P9EIT3_JUGRE|nr:uncharacterized protein LOC118348925 [Juglans regia]
MDLERAGIEVITSDTSTFMASLIVQPALTDRIKAAQKVDSGLVKLVEEVGNGDKYDLSVSKDGVLRFSGRLCALANDKLKRVILKEAHCSLYTSPGEYQDVSGLESLFEHQRLAGLLQPLQILEWKWEHIFMDFVTGLPRTLSGQDAIWVIVDHLKKIAHFVHIKLSYKLEKLAELYAQEIESDGIGEDSVKGATKDGKKEDKRQRKGNQKGRFLVREKK